MVIAHSRVTSQGQVSVPAKVRQRLGIGPGSSIEWAESAGQLVVHRAGQFNLEDARGALGFKVPTKARSLKELKEGMREAVRRRHAGH